MLHFGPHKSAFMEDGSSLSDARGDEGDDVGEPPPATPVRVRRPPAWYDDYVVGF